MAVMVLALVGAPTGVFGRGLASRAESRGQDVKLSSTASRIAVEVILNISALWKRSDFRNAVTSCAASKGAHAAALLNSLTSTQRWFRLPFAV